MKQYVFKCFKTKKASYVYDRSTGSLCVVNEKEYRELLEIEKGSLDPKKSCALAKYQQQGIILSNTVEALKHPETDYLEYHLAHRMKQLILQVTQQCNLRCGYCVYSGIYKDHREHQNKNMDWDTARKAIDFFIQRSGDTESMLISFYGGEPLLRIDLIKQCVDYAKGKVNGHKLRFNMTTNGTLLTDEVSDYLVKENFMVSISLDGPKIAHDVNRKFRSGEGSFDVIMENVRRLRQRHPAFASQLTFMTVINPRAELENVVEYFDTDTLMQNNMVVFNEMAETGLKDHIDYSLSYKLIRRYEYLKMLAAILGKIDRRAVSKLMANGEAYIKAFAQKMNVYYKLPKTVQRGGPCLAGSRRLFVTVDGKFYPCEKVNEESDFSCIGSLENGFDIEKVRQFINIGSITEEKCKDCWNLILCMMCFGDIETEDKDILQEKDTTFKCLQQQNSSYQQLYEYAVLSELGYKF